MLEYKDIFLPLATKMGADQKTIRHNLIAEHKQKLETLRAEFTKQCNEITAKAKQKISAVSESDQNSRKQILNQQEQELNKLLSQLTEKISQLNHGLLTKLEQMETENDNNELSQLDLQIKNL